jgi:hypothetical protein
MERSGNRPRPRRPTDYSSHWSEWTRSQVEVFGRWDSLTRESISFISVRRTRIVRGKCTSAIMRQLKTTREIKVMDEVTLQTLQRAQDSIKEK